MATRVTDGMSRGFAARARARAAPLTKSEEKERLLAVRLDYQPLFGKMSPHSSQRPDPGDGGNRA